MAKLRAIFGGVLIIMAIISLTLLFIGLSKFGQPVSGVYIWGGALLATVENVIVALLNRRFRPQPASSLSTWLIIIVVVGAMIAIFAFALIFFGLFASIYRPASPAGRISLLAGALLAIAGGIVLFSIYRRKK